WPSPSSADGKCIIEQQETVDVQKQERDNNNFTIKSTSPPLPLLYIKELQSEECLSKDLAADIVKRIVQLSVSHERKTTQYIKSDRQPFSIGRSRVHQIFLDTQGERSCLMSFLGSFKWELRVFGEVVGAWGGREGRRGASSGWKCS
ncbi:hypothetical protein BgiBS90_018997, partial [Biomphalaria glabrata]